MDPQETRSDELPTQALGAGTAHEGMAPGQRLGAFRIEAPIGRGGMGEVYRATQLEPVQRTVAIKRLRVANPGSRQAAWFEVERQVLAQMQHPNIAQLFDAGSLPDGSAYLVMEYIDGEPLTRWCREQRVPLRERLQLFLQLLDGVQHAHQRGVIHRDLKPGNVLVTRVNGRPVPKLIDFGIAAAAGSESVEIAGTADYMSPEQANPALGALDVRSDLYSLGVLLHELLTGERPFQASSRPAAHTRTTAPQAPSERLREMPGPVAGALAAELGVARRALHRLLRHELDWIVRRATAHDREQRYPSADAFAADVAAFLALRPVAAHPPSRRYRLGRFLIRNRLWVASAALALIALLGGLGLALYGLQEARAQRAVAELRAAEAAELAAFQQRMLRDLDPARMGQEILERAGAQARRTPGFQSMTPDEQAGSLRLLQLVDAIDLARSVLDSQLLARAEAVVEADFADRPLLAAQLRDALAEVHAGLGAPARAAALYAAVAEARDAGLGPAHPDTLLARLHTAQNLLAAGRREQAGGQLDALEVDASRLSKERQVEAAMARADWLAQGGDYAAAAARLEAAAGQLAGLAGQAALSIRLHAQWAGNLLRMGERDAARATVDRALDAATAALDAADPAVLEGLNGAIPVRAGSGDVEGALALSEALHAKSVQRFGHEHPFTLTQINNRAVTLVTLQRHEEAIPLLRELVEARRRVLGTRHPQTLKSEGNLASALMRSVQDAIDDPRRTERGDEAEAVLRRVLAAREDLLGADHPETLLSRASLASVLMHLGRADEALPLAERVLAARRARHGEAHRDVMDVRDLVADIQLARGDHAAARSHFEAVLDWRRREEGEGAERTLSVAVSLYRSLPPGSAARQAMREGILRAFFEPSAGNAEALPERLRRALERAGR